MIVQVDNYISKLGNTKIEYVVSLPKDYDKTKKYPLIIALSGDGAKSSAGIERMKSEGMNAPISKGMEIPFIVFSPQTPFADYETVYNNQYLPGVMSSEAVDIAASRYSVDTKRVYIFSLSMSGPSAPNALAYFPEKFAAGCSCGSWETNFQEAIKIKGGIMDVKSCNDGTAGPPDYNITFIRACKNAKDAKVIVLDNVGHTGWYEASSGDWLRMNTCPSYPQSDKPVDLYKWYLQFTTDGFTPTIPTDPTPPTTDPNPPITPTQPTNSNQMVIKDSTGKVLLGKIEAEAYSNTNKTGVFTETTTDAGSGKNIGWIKISDYLTYNVNIPLDGTYDIEMRIASVKDTQIQIKTGTTVLAVVNIPSSGGWQAWKSIHVQVPLKAGNQPITFTALNDGWNFNNFIINPYSIVVNGFLLSDE